MTTQLVRYEAACHALAEAKNVDEVAQIREKAEAVRAYARIAKNRELETDAAEIRIRAERRLGEMLREQKATVGMNTGTAGAGNPSWLGGSHLEPPNSTTVPTLSEVGIDKKLSMRSQKLAELEPEEFEEQISDWRQKIERGGDRISVDLARKMKEEQREQRRRENIEMVRQASDPAALEGVYSTIVIDPPWDWGDEGDVDQLGRARPTYATMSIEELHELPVGKLADGDAHLYLWITNRSLPKGFALLDSWEFRYVTCITWVKPSFGMGNYFRGQTEHVLFGVRGSLPLKRRDVGTVFEAPRGAVHSQKPAEFYGLVESCSPAPFLEMFARGERDGWTAWGGEL